MSENDPRFGYPLEFVKQHILGCFEASKACAIIPGKPHLYHVEFLRRQDSTLKDGSALPVDFHLQAHFSPCDEVSWYLHTREPLPTFEGSVEPDEQFVKDNEAGVVKPASEPEEVSTFTHTLMDPMTEKEKASYMLDAVQAHMNRTLSLLSSTTPEISKESVVDTFTDTFGCKACASGGKDLRLNHSRNCKARRSRFDKLNEELNRGKT